MKWGLKMTGQIISAQDGAQTTLYCLLEDAFKMQTGKFYSQTGIYKDPQYEGGGWPLTDTLPNPHVAVGLYQQ